MQTSGGAARRVVVRVGPRVWREEVERYGQRSPARAAAERERRRLEDGGVALAELTIAELGYRLGRTYGGPISRAPSQLRRRWAPS